MGPLDKLVQLSTFRYYTEWHDYVNRRQYDVPADPWKLLQISPDGIESWAQVPLYGLGRVESGEWDTEEQCRQLSELPPYVGLKQRFEDGYDWEATRLYERAKEKFAEHGTARGYDSLEAYRANRCAYLDELYASMRDDGYRPNETTEHDNPAAEDNRFEDAYIHHLEPLVVIGRSGEFILTEGLHRFTIASILDIEPIPVYVLCRHEQWQQRRDAVSATSPAGENPDNVDTSHPDLQDLRS